MTRCEYAEVLGMKSHVIAVAVGLSLAPALVAAQQTSPYAGEQNRAVKSLSKSDVRAYLAGDGLGMAKAGELNHYPGPKHVLAIADHLMLSSAQRQRIEGIAAAMTAQAQPLGRQIVNEEASLNDGFANGAIDAASLRRKTSHIALLQGQLRAVHLGAHLALKRILSEEQVRRYDHLRGYDDSGTVHASEHHHG